MEFDYKLRLDQYLPSLQSALSLDPMGQVFLFLPTVPCSLNLNEGASYATHEYVLQLSVPNTQYVLRLTKNPPNLNLLLNYQSMNERSHERLR
ncbi:unnamed protein product [Schistosoma mattheei]|uniref:Uncharacterized protein n=1 Tax=Schistosoma mattheei TaxID=31246 RepID=A0A183PA12_9TREM|nr:unnamed protein product [Schistosoma mattheei]